jgi:hypothetical protein
MAPIRHQWTAMETDQLIKNYDSPIQELLRMFPRHGQASINRKITRLRQKGLIGHKTEGTKRRAYRLRYAE